MAHLQLREMATVRAASVDAMQTNAAVQDDQVLTFDDAYLVEMTHRIARLRELHAAMEDTSKPRRWIDTLNLDTLR